LKEYQGKFAVDEVKFEEYQLSKFAVDKVKFEEYEGKEDGISFVNSTPCHGIMTSPPSSLSCSSACAN
jgi:hypothetical protein